MTDPRRPFHPTAMSRLAIIAALVFGALGLSIGAASAHADLVSSQPGDGQTVSTAPRQITLTFTEAVQSVQVSVRGDDGQSVAEGQATVEGSLVHQPVRIVAGGAYLVSYRVVSDDGHPVTGDLTFTYAGAGDAASPVSSGDDQAKTTQDDAGAGSGLWWVLGVSVAVVAGLAVFTFRRRARGA